MTGKEQKAEGSRQKAASKIGGADSYSQGLLPTAVCRLPSAFRGFTLLELMIVITVIIILAAIVLPQYQKTILATREAVLRDSLFKMRSLLDQYAADKQKLPTDLSDLVTAGYMRELPKDPITGNADWQPVPGEDPNSSTSESGIVDVHSASPEISSDGTPYSQW